MTGSPLHRLTLTVCVGIGLFLWGYIVGAPGDQWTLAVIAGCMAGFPVGWLIGALLGRRS